MGPLLGRMECARSLRPGAAATAATDSGANSAGRTQDADAATCGTAQPANQYGLSSQLLGLGDSQLDGLDANFVDPPVVGAREGDAGAASQFEFYPSPEEERMHAPPLRGGEEARRPVVDGALHGAPCGSPLEYPTAVAGENAIRRESFSDGSAGALVSPYPPAQRG